MANSFFDLNVVPVNGGIGTVSDLLASGQLKTISVSGNFQGTYTVETSDDLSCWQPVIAFSGSGQSPITKILASRYWRVRSFPVTGPGLPVISIGASDGDFATIYANLPLPAPLTDGVGAAADVSAMSGEKTILVTDTFGFTGILSIEASQDGANFFTAYTFDGAEDPDVLTIIARFMRLRISRYLGGAPCVRVGAEQADGGGGIPASQADWDINNARTFAIDPDNGNDANVGYSDGPVGLPATDAAAVAVAKQTIDGFAAIFPLVGAGRGFRLLLVRSGNWASGGNDYPLPASGIFNTLALTDGYVGPVVIGYGQADNSALLDGSALATAVGAVAGGYVPMGVPTATSFDFELNGGGAPGFAADALLPFFIRFRNVPAVQPALRDVTTWAVKNTVGPDNVITAFPLPAAPLLTDEFDIIQQGASLSNFYYRNTDMSVGSSVLGVRAAFVHLQSEAGALLAQGSKFSSGFADGPGTINFIASTETGLTFRSRAAVSSFISLLEGSTLFEEGCSLEMGQGVLTGSLSVPGVGKSHQGLFSFDGVRHAGQIETFGPVRISNPWIDIEPVFTIRKSHIQIELRGTPTGLLTVQVGTFSQETVESSIIVEDGFINAALSLRMAMIPIQVTIPMETLLATQVRDTNNNLLMREFAGDNSEIGAPLGPSMVVATGGAVPRFSVVRMSGNQASLALANGPGNAYRVVGVTLNETTAADFLLVAINGKLPVRWNDALSLGEMGYLSEAVSGRGQSTVPPPTGPAGNQKLRLGFQMNQAFLFTAFDVALLAWNAEKIPIDSDGVAP